MDLIAIGVAAANGGSGGGSYDDTEIKKDIEQNKVDIVDIGVKVDELESDVADASTLANNVQSQLDNLVLNNSGSSDVAPEVIQARTDLDGTTHATLKARLDADQTALKTDILSVEEDLENLTDRTNLIDFTNTTYTIGGVTITTTSSGTIRLTGTSTIDGGRTRPIGNTIALRAGTYYFRSDFDKIVLNYKATNNSIISATTGGNKWVLAEDTEVYVGVTLTKDMTYDTQDMRVMLCVDENKEYVPAKKAVDVVARNDVKELTEVVANNHRELGLEINIIPNVYVKYQNGTTESLSVYFATDYIPCNVGSISVKTKVEDDLSGIAFYDAGKNFISGYNPFADNETEVMLDVPDYAAFVRISCLTSYESSFVCRYSDVLPEIANKISGLSNDMIKVNGGELDISSDLTYNSGYYINYRGELVALSSYTYTDSIVLKRGEKINVTATVISAGAVSYLSKWTEEGTFIKSLVLSTDESPQVAEYTATDEVEYIRICFHHSKIVNGKPIVKKTIQSVDELREQVTNNTLAIQKLSSADISTNFWTQAMWKVLCIGDSLTSGANYKEEWGEQTSTGASIDQNYPRMLGRLINGEVTNAGFSGYSASTWWNSKKDTYTFADYDTLIIWLGTNNGLTDTLETDVNPYSDYNDFATTETGYYCKIIEKIRAENESCLIILTKVFASKGDVATTNGVIDKIAQKYSLPVIDNSDLGQGLHPELHAGINNVHFGKAGNAFIANRYVTELGKWFAENPLRCEYHYTQRTN